MARSRPGAGRLPHIAGTLRFVEDTRPTRKTRFFDCAGLSPASRDDRELLSEEIEWRVEQWVALQEREAALKEREAALREHAAKLEAREERLPGLEAAADRVA